MRKRATAIGIAAVLCCFIGGASALAATASGTPKGGAIHVFVNPGNGQGNGTILITGAIGDFGSTHSFHTKAGTFAYGTLQHGKLEFDLTKINAKTNSVSPKIDAATCSASFSVSAPVTILSGTGLYNGAHGTVMLTESFGFIGPRFTTGAKKGQCNLSNSAQPVGQMGNVHGAGTVSF
jgi:hypothetical protein